MDSSFLPRAFRPEAKSEEPVSRARLDAHAVDPARSCPHGRERATSRCRPRCPPDETCRCGYPAEAAVARRLTALAGSELRIEGHAERRLEGVGAHGLEVGSIALSKPLLAQRSEGLHARRRQVRAPPRERSPSRRTGRYGRRERRVSR